jgi:hypothetical protein
MFSSSKETKGKAGYEPETSWVLAKRGPPRTKKVVTETHLVHRDRSRSPSAPPRRSYGGGSVSGERSSRLAIMEPSRRSRDVIVESSKRHSRDIIVDPPRRSANEVIVIEDDDRRSHGGRESNRRSYHGGQTSRRSVASRGSFEDVSRVPRYVIKNTRG